ncbi:hypothetical protein ERJ70_07930 [Sediminibacillus dalangtanensis]|uniref:Lipoprotein n=1 Tax=Sediminibacillus dalangtanensis TaxID=2729421 RepID=A0ABX7VXC2_9BACI|nr:hypothetical protein [Sediminibacillus dalangtanensis]QTM99236.1 hypothetical protein ERJ70_07930 [Sediminibacillus dalangtanensis]
MRAGLLFLIGLSFVMAGSACSDDDAQPVMVKSEEHADATEKKPVLVEKDTEEKDEDSEPEEMLLEFTLPNEQVVIDLNQVTILKHYLSAVPDREAEIEDMSLTRVDIPDKDTIYLLEFTCREDSCSYLLLNQQEEGGSYLAADLAMFKSASISPENDLLLLLFNRKEPGLETDISKDKMVIVDLEQMSRQRTLMDSGEPFKNEYHWPVLSASWKNNQVISVTVPAISGTEESLETWYLSDQPTKTIELTIE